MCNYGLVIRNKMVENIKSLKIIRLIACIEFVFCMYQMWFLFFNDSLCAIRLHEKTIKFSKIAKPYFCWMIFEKKTFKSKSEEKYPSKVTIQKEGRVEKKPMKWLDVENWIQNRRQVMLTI